jgi:hypothetical protein
MLISARALWAVVLGLCNLAQAQPVCRASAATQQAQVVELYTSEGCDACPPADRWLSGLAQRPGVVALAFHVDYWDRLGWADRFASPLFTARQAQQVASAGAGFAYTPQVLVNGRDWRGRPRLPAAEAKALVALSLVRGPDGAVLASVLPLAGAPDHLALWWALLEDGHVSQILAGENKGARLHHDRVVRQYGQVAAWRSQSGAVHDERLPWARLASGEHAARWVAVVVDGDTRRPLQALQLDC